MKYIIVKNDSITKEMLESVNSSQLTQPTPIYIVEPDLDQGISGVLSNYSYVQTSDEFPNKWQNYKKLTQDQFNSEVNRIKSGQTVQNKVENDSPSINSPFASKEISGKRLFKRVHGITASVQNAPDTINFNVPYDNCKITEIEIIGGAIGDKCDLYVVDTPTGTISGVNDLVLNQFGYSVNVAKDYYSHSSNYDADLIKDMKVRIVYDAKDELLPKTIGINIVLHELK